MKKHHHDVLGMALSDFFSEKNDKKIIVHSPDFEEDAIPVSYYFRSEAQLPRLEKKAIDLCRGRVLDAGAGAGSHALILQGRGMDVTALDISAGACSVMKERGLRSVLNQDLCSDMDMKFDTILMLMNGIGVTGTIAGFNSFLKRIPSLLNPGGQIIFDSTNLMYLLQEEDGSVLMNLNDVYYGEIEFQIEYNNYISESFNWLYIDYDTLEWLTEEAGLAARMIEEGPEMSYLATITYQV